MHSVFKVVHIPYLAVILTINLRALLPPLLSNLWQEEFLKWSQTWDSGPICMCKGMQLWLCYIHCYECFTCYNIKSSCAWVWQHWELGTKPCIMHFKKWCSKLSLGMILHTCWMDAQFGHQIGGTDVVHCEKSFLLRRHRVNGAESAESMNLYK